MAKGKSFVGVSGFSYPSWKGKFYPEGMKSEDFLGFYSKRLNSVEINSTFYAPPSGAMVKSWSAKTNDSFRLAFKAPRQVTHILKLGKGASDAAQRMSTTLDSLGSRRGPILFQLPPYSKQDPKLLEEFLINTSTIEKRIFEFRHESWLQNTTYKILEKNRAGFCVAETDDMKPVFKVTTDEAYFRFRREDYKPSDVEKWASKIAETAHEAKEVYVYLRHDESGENALLAEKLAGLL